MPAMRISYQQGDRFVARIGGHRVVIDQPEADGGEDWGPTPTELFVAGLASCVGFYAERFLRRHELPASGLEVECDFEMAEDRPARVGSIGLHVRLPYVLPEARREALQRVVEHCTVHNSIRTAPDVAIDIGASAIAVAG